MKVSDGSVSNGDESTSNLSSGTNRGWHPEHRSVVCLCHFCSTWLTFQALRAGEFVNCPHCLMETRLYIPGAPPPQPWNEVDFECTSIQWSASGSGQRCIVGKIRNCGVKDLAWMRLQFTLFNGLDLQVGAISDCIIGFPAGHVWSFQTPAVDELVVRASLPIVSTEYGIIRSGEPRAQSDSSAEASGKEDNVLLVGLPNTPLGKARLAEEGGRPRVPRHWSEKRTPSSRS